MKYSQKAIIIGGNHHNTLGVIRSLGRKGIKPFVVLTTKNPCSFVLKSKYIQRSYTVDGSDNALKLLMEKFTYDNQKNVLIGCHDSISSAIDLNRNVLMPYFEISGTKKRGEVTRLMNKKTMGELATKVGLVIPETIILNKTVFTKTINIPYPCITKPIESQLGSKSEIVICNNHEELASYIECVGNNNNFIVQSFVEKDFEFQMIGCSLCSGNEIIIPGVSIILRQSKSSNTGFLHYTSLDDSFIQTLEKTKSFIKETGYSGLFSVEFIRDKTGKDYFMEINFRNDGNAIAVTNAGVNLPYIWYLYCIGADYQSEIKTIHDEYVMPEFAELSLYRQGIISRKDWKHDMKKATSYMDYDAEDPMPTNGWMNYRKQKTKAQMARLIRSFSNSFN